MSKTTHELDSHGFTPEKFADLLDEQRASDRQGTPGADPFYVAVDDLATESLSLPEVNIRLNETHAKYIFDTKELADQLASLAQRTPATGDELPADTLLQLSSALTRLAPSVLSVSDLDLRPFDPGMDQLYAADVLKFIGEVRVAHRDAYFDEGARSALWNTICLFHRGENASVSEVDSSGVEQWARGVRDEVHRGYVNDGAKVARIRKKKHGTPSLLIARIEDSSDYTLRIVNLDERPTVYGKSATIDQLRG